MTTTAYALPQQSTAVRRRHWLSFLLLLACFSLAGPYDLANRELHETPLGDLQTSAALQGQQVEEGNPVRRGAIIAMAVVAVALLARAGKLARGSVNRWIAVPALLYGVVGVASVAWADDPAFAARRVAVFAILALTAWAIARSWPLADFVLFLTLACGATLLASIGLDVLRGAFHPLDADYRLAGLAHANNHAKECAVLILASLTGARLHPKRAWLWLSVALLGAIVLVVLTRSRTMALSVALALLAVPLLSGPRRRFAYAAFAAVAAAIVVGIFAPDAVEWARRALLFGRSAETADVNTLTGRTQLWTALMDYVREQPYGGYGFDAFWTPEHTMAVSLDQGWVVPHAHSGYLETMLGVGYVGVAAFVLALVAGLAEAARRARRDPSDVDASFALTVLAWVLIAMVSETVVPLTHYGSLVAMVMLGRVAIRPSMVRVVPSPARLTPVRVTPASVHVARV